MAAPTWHLVSYDVRDPKRLRRAAKKLQGYGERIQFSVFRCLLDQQAMSKLRWELAEILETGTDDLLVIPLCARCAGKIPKHSTGDCSDWVEPPPPFRIL